jgi:hypothetical protein
MYYTRHTLIVNPYYYRYINILLHISGFWTMRMCKINMFLLGQTSDNWYILVVQRHLECCLETRKCFILLFCLQCYLYINFLSDALPWALLLDSNPWHPPAAAASTAVGVAKPRRRHRDWIIAVWSRSRICRNCLWVSTVSIAIL